MVALSKILQTKDISYTYKDWDVDIFLLWEDLLRFKYNLVYNNIS